MRNVQAGFASAALLLSLLLASCGLPTRVSQPTAPTIEISAPVSGQEVVEGQEVVILFTATDAQGVARVEVGMDGVLLQTVLNSAPAANIPFTGQHTWNAETPGSHSAMAVAYNTAGVASAPAVVQLTVASSGGGPSPQSGASSGGGSGPTPTWTAIAAPSDTPPPPVEDTPAPPPPTDTIAPPPATETPLPPAPTPAPTATPKPTSAPVASTRPAAPGLITDFETFGTWKRGDQPNGTFVQSAERAHSGSYSGKLAYDFPDAGNDFVVFSQTFPLGGRPNQVSAWVYGDGSKHFLNVWLKDAAGETWQFTLGQVKHSGWQQMVATLDPGAPWPAAHVDGPSNGAIDYPIDLRALVLDDVPDPFVGGGAIYIDDLRCAEGAVPEPAPEPAGASIRFWADATTIDAGACTQLHWDVSDVRAVYLDGEGVVGQGGRQVCPGATRTYVLRVVHTDGTRSEHPLTIEVTSP